MSIITVNPATGDKLANYDLMPADEALAVLGRTQHAYLSWREVPTTARAARMVDLAAVLRDGVDDYAALMTLEMGKPINEARAEVEKCAWLCDFYAENAPAWLADQAVVADGLRHRVIYQPLGVVLSVMPWNFPFWQALRFGVPTLAAGNTSVLKHASCVTGCGLAIEQLFVKAGFPADVFRTVVAGHETVAHLIAADEVRGVSLTGSTDVGRDIAEAAGRNLKKVVLELGGSDPFIVLADADIELAVQGAVTGRMLCTGQSCIAAKRFIVVQDVADRFAARFAEQMARLKVGDPLRDDTQVGSMVNEKELLALQDQVDDAVAKGARVLTGGKRLSGSGAFYPPTVLSDTTPEMRVVNEEVFGPVAPVIVVPDEETAVAVANASEFGLGGSVWTADLERGEKIARQLECGTTFVNSIVKSDPRMPFGGVKNSGLGRELSKFGLREFTNIKGLNIYGSGV